MLAYQCRVIEEKMDLAEKVEKLGFFLEGNVFKTLNNDEKLRMQQQLIFMELYLKVLKDRIASFEIEF